MVFSKIIVLKQIIQNENSLGKIVGVCHIEKNEKYSFTVELYNKPSCPFYLTIIDGQNKVITTPLEDKLKQTYSHCEHLDESSILVCVSTNTIQIDIIALGYYNYTGFSYNNLITLLKTQVSEPKIKYDDEQIASENYYKYSTPYQTTKPDCEDKSQKEKEKFDFSPPINEELYHPFEKTYTINLDKLNEILSNNSRYDFLSQIFNCGKFVKITHSIGQEYIIGAIYYDNSFSKVKYLCFATCGTKDNLPKTFNGKSKFIPFKQYEPYSSGVHIVFQDAISGKIV